jgi:hypothetical protein
VGQTGLTLLAGQLSRLLQERQPCPDLLLVLGHQDDLLVVAAAQRDGKDDLLPVQLPNVKGQNLGGIDRLARLARLLGRERQLKKKRRRKKKKGKRKRK